jgi:zinc resistance-associated protein
MNSRLSLLMIALLGSGLSLAAFKADAQQPPPVAPPSPPGMEKHGPMHSHFSPVDRAAFFDAHLAGLHAGLELTPDQDKLWPALETALRNGAKSAHARHEKAYSEPRPADVIAWLRRLSEEDMAKGETLKALADAAAPLFASLSEEQRHRLPFLLHGIKPHALGADFSQGDGGGDEDYNANSGDGPQEDEGAHQGGHHHGD